jgi:hypothetical protein
MRNFSSINEANIYLVKFVIQSKFGFPIVMRAKNLPLRQAAKR